MADRRLTLRLAARLMLGIGLLATVVPAARAAEVPVAAIAFDRFDLRSDRQTFGPLEFLGGLDMTSAEPLFGALSAIRFRPDGKNFVAILDTGHFLTGRLRRDGSGRLSGIEAVEISEMRRSRGLSDSKYDVDAESLALRDDEVLVGFERRHRIELYKGADFATTPPVATIPSPFPKGALRSNGGMEMLAVAPPTSPLGGALVTIAERSVDAEGNLFAAIVDGPLKGAFRLRKTDGFDVTDGAFLPEGDLLVLERRFRLSSGVAFRIRRIAAGDLRPGALVDGPVLIAADGGNRIDNMEGMDLVRGEDGSLRLILVSDDNHSLLQRNLMLEFRFVGTP